MRIPTSVGYALGTVAAILLLASCSGGNPQVAPLSNSGSGDQSTSREIGDVPVRNFLRMKIPPAKRGVISKSWMKHVDANSSRFAYMSDALANNVTVYGRNGTVVGQIGGLSFPQGLFVDFNRNLWVANSSGQNVLEFARGGTSPINTLNDPGFGGPGDVTICANGTIYVSNLGTNASAGNIVSYAPGSTNPTGTLTFPGAMFYLGITCDRSNNVFATIITASLFKVIGYPGGNQSGAYDLGIPGFAVGVLPDNAGNLLVADMSANTITEYTEAGSPTGKSIATGAGTIGGFAVTRNGRVVGVANSVAPFQGLSYSFPGGALRQTYLNPNSPSNSEPEGFAFDPGQKGFGD